MIFQRKYRAGLLQSFPGATFQENYVPPFVQIMVEVWQKMP